jgi:hypothetical protein
MNIYPCCERVHKVNNLNIMFPKAKIHNAMWEARRGSLVSKETKRPKHKVIKPLY